MKELKGIAKVIILCLFVIFSNTSLAETFDKALIMPQDIIVEDDGSMIITDTYQHRIVRVNGEKIETITGKKGQNGYLDGDIKVALFNKPKKIAKDKNGVLYIADTGNNVIRKVVGNNVFTVAGNGEAGYRDGSVKEAQFKSPMGIEIDSNGNLYIADTGNHIIRKIDTKGNVSTFAGNALGFGLDQNGETSQSFFNEPVELALSPNGNMLVVDSGNHKIKSIKNGIVKDVLLKTNLKYPKDVIWIDSNKFLIANTWDNNIIEKNVLGSEKVLKESKAVSIYVKNQKLYEVLPWEHRVEISEFKNNISAVSEKKEIVKEELDDDNKTSGIKTIEDKKNGYGLTETRKEESEMEIIEKESKSLVINGKFLDKSNYYFESDFKVWVKLDYILEDLKGLAKWDKESKQMVYKAESSVSRLNFDDKNYKYDSNGAKWIDFYYVLDGLDYKILKWNNDGIEVVR